MTNPGKLVFVPGLMLAILTAGCHKNDSDQVNAAENGNLAPVSDNGGAAPVNESAAPASAPAYSAPLARPAPLPLILRRARNNIRQQRAPQSSTARAAGPVPAAAISGSAEPGLLRSGSDQGYQDQVAEYAPEPPPPLPEYQQPPCPEPNYIWTPGYWSYAPAGFYWVPGVWAFAPYTGALWTPGYWGYDSDRYGWHQGYWGRYIGYYGGVNYGNGYVGPRLLWRILEQQPIQLQPPGHERQRHRHPQYLYSQRDQYHHLQPGKLQRRSGWRKSSAERCGIGCPAAAAFATVGCSAAKQGCGQQQPRPVRCRKPRPAADGRNGQAALRGTASAGSGRQ